MLQAVRDAGLHHQNTEGRIRLWVPFQEEEDGCTSPEMPSMRRVALSCSVTSAIPPWRWGTLGMLHPSAPALLDSCCRWQRSLPKESLRAQPWPTATPHRAVISRHLTGHSRKQCWWFGSEIKWPSLSSITQRCVPWFQEHARIEPGRVQIVGPSATMSSLYWA